MHFSRIGEKEEADMNTNMVITRAEIPGFFNFIAFILFTQPKYNPFFGGSSQNVRGVWFGSRFGLLFQFWTDNFLSVSINWMCMIEIHLSMCSLTPARPKLPVYSPWIRPWLPQPTNLVALTRGSNTLNHHPFLLVTYRCICHCYIKLGSQKCNLRPRVILHKAWENKITREHAPKQHFLSL